MNMFFLSEKVVVLIIVPLAVSSWWLLSK